MAYSLKVKYFNSFWLKKVVGKIPSTAFPVPPAPGFDANDVTTTINYYKNTGARLTPLPTWPGLPWNPTGYPTFPWGYGLISEYANPSEGYDRQWFVEESRIEGGYNNTQVSLGVRAYITEEIDEQRDRSSSLIYSGPLNSRTKINETNVFSVGQDITKSLDPANGTLQKLFAEDTNLTIFQESKVSKALIDKDAVYSAEGSPMQTQSNVVIGQIVPYLGEYGISTHPESFAFYGYAKYFADKDRNAILRLSRDGITEISNYGMVDFFRDELSAMPDGWLNVQLDFTIGQIFTTGGDIYAVKVEAPEGCSCCNIETGMSISIDGVKYGEVILDSVFTPDDPAGDCQVIFSNNLTPQNPVIVGDTITFTKYDKSRIVGGWDIHQKNYVISLQNVAPELQCDYESVYSTLGFDETINGWVSFYSYKPTLMDSLKSNFYSGNYGDLYLHNSTVTPNSRGMFYGVYNDSSVTTVFNSNPSIAKNFQTINYEGSNGWEVDLFISGDQGPDNVGGGFTISNDSTNFIYSYDEGVYIDPIDGVTYRSGFNRKENKYFANLINNSSINQSEVIFGDSMSGIKGFYATVQISTDSSTQPGGKKELFSAGSKFVMSSQ